MSVVFVKLILWVIFYLGYGCTVEVKDDIPDSPTEDEVSEEVKEPSSSVEIVEGSVSLYLKLANANELRDLSPDNFDQIDKYGLILEPILETCDENKSGTNLRESGEYLPASSESIEAVFDHYCDYYITFELGSGLIQGSIGQGEIADSASILQNRVLWAETSLISKADLVGKSSVAISLEIVVP